MRAARVAFVMLGLAASGCATPKPVTGLAEVTAQNTSALQSQLAAFSRRQAEISGSRVRIVTDLQRSLLEAEAQREREIDIRREVGINEPAQTYERLRRRATESVRQAAATRDAIAETRRGVEDTQHKLTVPAEALLQTAKALSTLSEALSFKGHLELLFSFFSDVGEDVKKAQEDARKAAGHADAKADRNAKDAEATVATKP